MDCTEQVAVWVGDDGVGQALVLKASSDHGHGLVGAQRGRPGLHHFAHWERVIGAVEGRGSQPAEQRALGGGDKRKTVRGAGDADTHVGDGFIRAGGDHLMAQVPANRGRVGAGPRHSEVAGEPVDLAGYVVIDFGEPERREPARGSGAEVSKGIPAVDDDRACAVESGRGGGVERLERDVDRAGQVHLGVLLGG
jgi:hypothetical protein